MSRRTFSAFDTRRPRLRFLGVLGLVSFVTVLAPCSTTRAADAWRDTRPITRVWIKKQDHALYLMTTTAAGGEEVVATYKVAIGPGGAGPKRREGDMVTPVGRYRVTMHQPSKYKVFLRLDYPNAEDQARFAASKRRGELERDAKIGGDIGVHGPPVSVPAPLKPAMKLTDWTAGCVAVDDDEISEIARRVRDGTPVDIED